MGALLELHWDYLSNSDLALQEPTRESQSSCDEVEPMRAITMVMSYAFKLTLLQPSLKNTTQVTFEFRRCERRQNMPWKAQENYILAEDWNWRHSWKSSLHFSIHFIWTFSFSCSTCHVCRISLLILNLKYIF